MAVRLPAARAEVHHEVPRCLLRLRDKAHGLAETGQDIQDWLDWEEEANRHGVSPEVTREELEALIEGSTVEIPREEHRDGHTEDFARWGRRGGLATLARYGAGWFVLLARRRWEKVTADELAEAFGVMGGGRS